MNEEYIPSPGDIVRVGFSVGVVLDVYRSARGMALKVLTVANIVKVQRPELVELGVARQARLARATADELYAELKNLQDWYASRQQEGLDALNAALSLRAAASPPADTQPLDGWRLGGDG